MMLFAIICVAILGRASALYSPSSGVVDLTPSNFQREVINSDAVWIVEFYVPGCGHCQRLVPDYQDAAAALRGVIKFGAVNADNHKSMAGQYGVQRFPTIKIFGLDKKYPEVYNGQRTAQAFVDAGMKAVRDKVNAQLSSTRSNSGGGGGSGRSESPDGVIELTDSNFEKLVLKSDEFWLVEFFAPWCGFCKDLAPHWQNAASELNGKIKMGKLDATEHTVMASRYGVEGYPTIKFFNKGEIGDYDGQLTASDIVSWVGDNVWENVPPPEIVQITKEATLTEACKELPICIIAVLPHILDCQTKCRNAYMEILIKLGDKYKQNMWGWVWSEAMAQPELEQALDIGGFGYPTLAALHTKKMRFALFKGSFSEIGINEFLRDISYSRGRVAPVLGGELPSIVKTEPWDRKDGALPEEEDIDLSDDELDGLDDNTHEEL